MSRWPGYIARASSSARSGGSSGGLEKSTPGCFSTIGKGAKPTPIRSHSAPRAASGLSARTSRGGRTELRARSLRFVNGSWFVHCCGKEPVILIGQSNLGYFRVKGERHESLFKV